MKVRLVVRELNGAEGGSVSSRLWRVTLMFSLQGKDEDTVVAEVEV